MPYKNKEDKKANARFHYNKGKGKKVCAWEKCDSPLPTNRNKFCCDGCSDNYFAKKIRLEKQKARELNDIERFCAYEQCGEKIPKGTHAQKRYCPGTDCAYKQNQLDQKRQRAEKKKNKEIVFVKCRNDECKETIEKHHLKKYCSKECRRSQNNRDYEKRKFIESMQYKATKEEAEQLYGNKKKIKIDAKYLTRGIDTKKVTTTKAKEIKHFSVKWLEQAWLKVRHEYLKDMA